MSNRIATRGFDREFNDRAYTEADRLFEQGRYRDALRLFQAVAEADPSDGDAFMAIGNCWDALGKPQRAEQAFRQALALAAPNDHPSVLFNLGNALFDQALFAEALAAYQSVPSGIRVSESARRNAQLASQRIADAS
jgi:tetratricopeptide (TPR) repeat protein